jgi:hypothetical protein
LECLTPGGSRARRAEAPSHRARGADAQVLTCSVVRGTRL